MIRQIKVECVNCVNYVRTDPATVVDTLEMYLRVGASLPPYDEHGVIELGTVCPDCLEAWEEQDEWREERRKERLEYYRQNPDDPPPF